MKYNTKVCMYKIPIKQLNNNESSDHYLPCSCRMQERFEYIKGVIKNRQSQRTYNKWP
jgi:hypothetical protein